MFGVDALNFALRSVSILSNKAAPLTGREAIRNNPGEVAATTWTAHQSTGFQ
jgi:hypothetical protein